MLKLKGKKATSSCNEGKQNFIWKTVSAISSKVIFDWCRSSKIQRSSWTYLRASPKSVAWLPTNKSNLLTISSFVNLPSWNYSKKLPFSSNSKMFLFMYDILLATLLRPWKKEAVPFFPRITHLLTWKYFDF